MPVIEILVATRVGLLFLPGPRLHLHGPIKAYFSIWGYVIHCTTFVVLTGKRTR